MAPSKKINPQPATTSGGGKRPAKLAAKEPLQTDVLNRLTDRICEKCTKRITVGELRPVKLIGVTTRMVFYHRKCYA